MLLDLTTTDIQVVEHVSLGLVKDFLMLWGLLETLDLCLVMSFVKLKLNV